MAAITQLHQIDLHSGRITKPRWSPNGRLLALPTESGSTSIFDIGTGQVAQTLASHSVVLTSVCWDRESESIMTGSLDGSIGVWEVKSGRRAQVAPAGHREAVLSVEWTDEGAYAMTCSVERVRAWDGFCLQVGWTEAMENLANKNSSFTAAACSYQTTLLLGIAAENGTLLQLMSLVSADLLDSRRIDDPAQCLAWSPRESLLAVAGSRSIRAFRTTQTGFEEPVRELSTDVTDVHALAFSGNGRLLAARDAQGLRIWDVKSGTLIVELPETVEIPEKGVTSGIAFNPVRPLLATVTPNGNEFRILDLSQLV